MWAKFKRQFNLAMCRWVGCRRKWDGNELLIPRDSRPGRIVLDKFVCKRCGLRWREHSHL